ncbi:hypothetical protein T439DRAFT_243096 [Meredithblackwellia eburnea MCA 4105]
MGFLPSGPFVPFLFLSISLDRFYFCSRDLLPRPQMRFITPVLAASVLAAVVASQDVASLTASGVGALESYGSTNAQASSIASEVTAQGTAGALSALNSVMTQSEVMSFMSENPGLSSGVAKATSALSSFVGNSTSAAVSAHAGSFAAGTALAVAGGMAAVLARLI